MSGRFLLIAGVIALIVLSGGAVSANWKKRGEKYLPLLNATERKYGIPKDLLARLAYQESRFRDDIITGKIVSSAGAMGIMQIVPKYHPTVNTLDVPASIDYAGKILSQWKKQFGTWELALAAYNAGPGNVTKYKGIPPFTETKNYVSQIKTDVPSMSA